jgi:endonuclease YncB( thermonuclease family)
LPDPAKRLEGKGNVVRNIRLYDIGEPDAKVLDDPEVRDLINVALNRAKVSMPDKRRRKLVVKSISVKQRPRRV